MVTNAFVKLHKLFPVVDKVCVGGKNLPETSSVPHPCAPDRDELGIQPTGIFKTEFLQNSQNLHFASP
ncbi:MAG: hypothetical protein DYG88_01290 [Chloroflexi bacterium CFX4]|nr:hypothetical protein [Chloroflexi bacterium CFX4]